MRFTQALIPTVKETPSGAEVVSHQYMLRAGMIRQVARGIYNYLPLGLRVIRKVEAVVREEMNRIGCQETLMPIIIPAELWEESGRWKVYGKELLRLKDRNGRDFCVGPTHEEVICDIARNDLHSYRDLPQNLYQINTKFRDEVRPRFGLMRGREFIMKDSYSFHATEGDLDQHYEKMYEVYTRIFQRCGLQSRAVEADTGSIGGHSSHEFVVLADTGEDAIAICDSCHYAANVEAAVSRLPVVADDDAPQKLEMIATPGQTSVEEVSALLKVPLHRMIKTMVFLRDGGIVVALTAGNTQINEVKLKKVVNAEFVTLADAGTIESLTKAGVGYAGPVGLPKQVEGIGAVMVVADESVATIVNGVTGANKTDYHVTGVCAGRDFVPDMTGDIRQVAEGERCLHCQSGKLVIKRGIEVGHLFKLGTKYSSAMKVHFLDEAGVESPMIMGCYGIGIGRTAASAIEQSHDDKGICWPLPIAPYHVHLISMNVNDPAVMTMSQEVYDDFAKRGIEVLWDDRDGRPGAKFADADLIGVPYHVVIGSKAVQSGKLEVKVRKSDERLMCDVRELADRIHHELAEARK